MMKVMVPRIFIVCMAVFLGACASDTSRLADQLVKAESEQAVIPVLSQIDSGFDVESAWVVQKHYIKQKLKQDTLAGFKAGLTSKSGQQKFGVTEPVFGALFAQGQASSGGILQRQSYQRMMLETELGFILQQTVTEMVPSVEGMKQVVGTIVPVIEVPDLGFSDMKALTYADILAANVSSRQFIVGQGVDATNIDVNALQVTLMHNGEVINHGQGVDALGDQWQAALWLTNQAIAQGWELKAGQLLITGALGKMLPAKPGTYVADYQSLGTITFDVE